MAQQFQLEKPIPVPQPQPQVQPENPFEAIAGTSKYGAPYIGIRRKGAQSKNYAFVTATYPQECDALCLAIRSARVIVPRPTTGSVPFTETPAIPQTWNISEMITALQNALGKGKTEVLVYGKVDVR